MRPRFRCTLADVLVGMLALACLLGLGRLAWRVAYARLDFASDAAWSPDGQLIAIAICRDAGSTIGIYDLEADAWTHQRALPAGSEALIRFTPDSRSLVVAGIELAVWDFLAGAAPRVIDRNVYDSIAVSPDGTKIAASAGDGLVANGVACWSLATGERQFFRTDITGVNPWRGQRWRSSQVFFADSQSLFLWIDGHRTLTRLDPVNGRVLDQAWLWLRHPAQFAVSSEGALTMAAPMRRCGMDRSSGWYQLETHNLGETPRDPVHGYVHFGDDSSSSPVLSPDGANLADFAGVLEPSGIEHVPQIEWGPLGFAHADVATFPLNPVASRIPPALAFSPDSRQLACAFDTQLQVAILSGGRVVLDVPVPGTSQGASWRYTLLALFAGLAVCLWHVARRRRLRGV